MKIELDNLIEVLEKIQDAGNLTAIQEETLLSLHNATAEYQAAKGDEKASRTVDLAAAAAVIGERSESLTRSMHLTLVDLHDYVQGLMTEAGEANETDNASETVASLYQTIADVRDGLQSNGSVGEAIELLGLALADRDDEQEADHA